jgi:hypothetical protein
MSNFPEKVAGIGPIRAKETDFSGHRVEIGPQL